MKETRAKPREGRDTPPESTPAPPNTQTADPRAQEEQEWYAQVRASKHKQGMAQEHELEPAAAIAIGIEGRRTDNEHEVHNSDRGNAIKTSPHPLSIGHQRGRKPPTPEKMWTPPKNRRRTRSHQH